MNKSVFLQLLKGVSLVGVLFCGGLAIAAEPDIPMSQSGIITQAYPEENEVVINRKTYALSSDAAVFLDGHRINTTDLQKGMSVSFGMQSGTTSQKVPTIQAIKILSGGEDILKH